MIMFKYDEQVDNWSYEMVKGIASVWGDPLIGREPNKDTQVLQASIDFLNSILDEVGVEVFKRFSRICEVNLKESDVHFFVNTVRVSLHNGEKKFVSLSLHHPLDSYPTILIHEIFHVFFHEFLYGVSCKDLEETILKKLRDRENDIKEYITVLINKEFGDVIDIDDEGYPDHLDIRNKILAQWCKERDFKKLLMRIVNQI